VTAEQALAGIVGTALLVLAAVGLHTLQVKLERWASNRPARQGRRSLLRDLFAVTTIGLLAVAVACLTASSAKAFPGDLAQAPLAQKAHITP
jgi:hypothetical protein